MKGGRGGIRRAAKAALLVVPCLLALVLASFALPVETWRTGELPAPPLDVVPGGPEVRLPPRVWIDTDTACGTGERNDPDDCFALLLIARTPGIEVVGVSTVFGNAPLADTDAVARDLLTRLRGAGAAVPPVHTGASGPMGERRDAGETPGARALRHAMDEGPLTIVALGPLTNLAEALRGAGPLAGHRLVAVMGRRPGHLFHPAEGEGDGVLFGHGPVFSDFNFAQDPEAVRRVMATGLPATLVPYEAGRSVTITADDLARLEASPESAWVAERAGDWLGFWDEMVGIGGFYPFDLAAAVYVADPAALDCAAAHASVARDEKLLLFPRHPLALLVGPEAQAGTRPVIYCTGIRPGPSAGIVPLLAGVSGR